MAPPSPEAQMLSAAELKQDRRPHMVASSIALIILPTLAVGLRLLSRRMARAGLWWDDYTIVVAMILSWGPCISNLDSARKGLGRHLEALPVMQLEALRSFFKSLYAFEFLYNVAMTSLRFSIILFLHRIFPIIHFRRALIGCAVFVGAHSISAILVSVFQCVPIHLFWDALGGKLSGLMGGRCIDTLLFFKVTSSFNTVLNFVLLGLPIPLLWKLRTSRLQKLVLTLIFITGLTVCAVSITHLVVLSNLHEDDLTWNYVDPAIWSAAEPSIGVVSACLPSLRPLFSRLIWGAAYRPKHLPHSSNRSKGWLGSSKEASSTPNGHFNRLRESNSNMGRPWVHNVAVTGGRTGDGEDEEHQLGARQSHHDLPSEGIRVRTTVTVTERVDWQSELF